MGKLYRRTNGKGEKIYYVDYVDASGKRKRESTKTTDLAIAEEVLKVKEADAIRIRHGIQSPEKSVSREPIGVLLKQWEDSKLAIRRSGGYLKTQSTWLNRFFSRHKIRFAKDITPEHIEREILHYRKSGSSDTSARHIHRTLGDFCRYLYRRDIIDRDITKTVNPVRGKRRAFERRALTREEWRELDRYLRKRSTPEKVKLTKVYAYMGRVARRALYLTAIQTGLRGGELATLTIKKTSLKSSPPFVWASGADTKSGEDAKQYVTPDLAADLEKIAKSVKGALLFPEIPGAEFRSDMLRADLLGARKLWLSTFKNEDERAKQEETDFLRVDNEDGEILNFHSLRYTCGHWLAEAGVDIRTVQRVMRHSSIQLTIDTYGRLMKGSEAEAIEKLGGWISAS